jgi:arylsulfatase B/arylsulfatase I/J
MHHEVTWTHQPWGLPLSQKLWPQELQEAGYSTHIVGKWHLGHHQRQYLPVQRGFDTFFGHLSPYVDYYTRVFDVPPSNFPGNNFTRGYDFMSQNDIDYTDPGTYITDLLNKRAIDIINTDDGKPFFLYLPHTAMHRANDDDPLPYKQADYDYYSFIENKERREYAGKLKQNNCKKSI